MGEGYGTLRLWSTVLMFVGILGVIFVVIGTIFAVFAAPTFWQGVGFLLIGGPLAVLFASWPNALGQGPRASPTWPSTSSAKRAASDEKGKL
jgi:hypothetical protein